MLRSFLFVIFSIFFISFSYSLKISEVYFDGRNEYIGIYSKDGFSGTVIISGAKKSNISIDLHLNKNEEIILGDNGIGNYFSGFNNFKTGFSLNISDTKPINIQLIYSGQVIDNFFVSESDVKKLNNKNTAFQKIFSGNNEIIKPVSGAINMKNGYIGNPGYVIFTGISNTGNLNNLGQDKSNDLNTGNYLDCGTYLIKLNNNQSVKSCDDIGNNEILNCFIGLNSKVNGVYNLYFTGNKTFTGIKWFVNNKFYKYGQNLSITGGYIKAIGNYKNYHCTGSFYIDKIDNQNSFTGKILINEVHAGNDKFGEYVELKSFGNFSGNLIFSGFLRGDNILDLPIQTYSGGILVLAKSYSGFIYTGNVIKIPNLSLLDNGETLSIISSGQIIDKVVYENKKSLYYSYTLDKVRYFKKDGIPTPGYENFIEKYYPEKRNYSCKILFNKFDNGKISLSSDVSDKNLCTKKYKQIWLYSGGVITGTCDLTSVILGTGGKKISFNIFSGNKILCKDEYNFFYDKKTIEKKIIQEKIKYLPSLNCSIKIQGKDDYFFDKDSINLIALVNGKEIQNSNTDYTCKFFLDGNILSDKCNPYSKKILAGLHNLTLSISSITGLNCQTTMQLNIPKLTEKDVLNSFNVDNFTNLRENLKSKYSQTTLKRITQPISYLYTGENYIKNLNSDELKNFVDIIKTKYSSQTTLKKIFEPISYLYKTSKTCSYNKNYLNISPLNCVKLNSTELKELVENINNKYKSKYTLKKIFNPVSYLFSGDYSSSVFSCTKLNSDKLKNLVENINNKYKSKSTLKKIFSPIKYLFLNSNLADTDNNNKINFAQFKNVKILKLIPYFYFNNKNTEAIVISGLTGTLSSGFYIGTEKRKYELSNYILTGKNYLFTGKFGLSKSKCLNLYFKNHIFDTICYIKKGKNILQTFRPTKEIMFKNNYILINNQIIKNKPFSFLKKRIKKAIKIIEQKFKKLKKENIKLKKENNLLYEKYINALAKYYVLKSKYKQEKENLLKENKSRFKKLREKNKEIKRLKNIKSFLKSFIIYTKQYIPKHIYRQYLDKYRQVLKGQKLRF